MHDHDRHDHDGHGALHDGETAVDAATVGRLLAAQLPALAGAPVARVASLGTVHHVFRIGGAHVVRLPRLGHWADDFPREAAVLDRVAGRIPLEVPRIVLVGEPGEGYPFRWAVQEWLPGEPTVPSADPAVDVERAETLAAALDALHRLPSGGLPAAGRRPLAALDASTRTSIDATHELDRTALTDAWDRALEAPAWQGDATVIHADLLPPNLVAAGGRITGLIDWGTAGAGDPAHDLVVAWATLRRRGRDRLRHLLRPRDGVWARARGIALHQALAAIPYYRHSHPAFAALNVATAREVLLDR